MNPPWLSASMCLKAHDQALQSTVLVTGQSILASFFSLSFLSREFALNRCVMLGHDAGFFSTRVTWDESFH